MSKIQEMAKSFGVEMGEKFNIRLSNHELSDYNPYVITEQGLVNGRHVINNGLLLEIILEKATVEKLPFKPQENEFYYFVTVYGHAIRSFWSGDTNDYYRYNANNCFKTEDEITEEVKERVLKEMKGKHEVAT